ncbi:ComF family protein [Occultella glacieicola]|uniref:ComF family protein n=1 Tax=Occultella glacieicola TaxID=2518684 RepID=A0ABY2E678_9MICO|nr:phosphoribosyltransferase family protein [Occultella glacieicola]TDE96093.1 ComF family protein [Occultella glacieicola]
MFGQVLTDVLALVLPVECPGCGAHDTNLCARCRAPLLAAPRRCEEDTVHLSARDVGGTGPPVLGLPTWALAPYAAGSRRLVLAWKTGVRPDLATELAGVGTVGGVRLAEYLGGALGNGPVLVVPAPSGWRRRLARRFVVGDLADAVAAGLSSGLADRGRARPVWVVDVLRRRGGSSHRLGAVARGRSARAVHLVADLPDGASCVLVDDVVTTGATLAAARDALTAAGAQVLGAFTLLATPRPGSTTWRADP